MTTLPTGTVTFLFSDIEGSTRLLHHLGDRYGDVLQTHRELMRAAFAAHEGHEFGTEGDSFFVAFKRATNAVAAAIDAQRALSSHLWPDDLAVRVRIGLHTGEPTISSGEYTGIDVHRASRISSSAHGGQVIISHTTKELSGSDLPQGVALRDMGEHRLKDLDRPEHLYQLVIPGIESDFPPLRTLTAHSTSLPAQSTELIGRERELETLAQKLNDGARLITLTGPGGAGKTRLAVQFGGTMIGDFDDGVHFIQLAPITDPKLIAQTIAQAIGVRESAHGDVMPTLKEHLAGREALLILDNFEQIIDGAPIVAELLAAAPNVRIVVTSREVLRLRGEQEFPVPPLALPDRAHPESLEKLSQYASVDLFIQRARAARPDFVVDNANAPAVAEICHRLDGLPLAIELAAARVKLFSPEAILTRLGKPLELLKGGARDLPDRHQTLRQAIAWSYDLLDEGERRIFRQLSVFVGGWDYEAGEGVCDDLRDIDIDVLDAMTALVDKSLLRHVDGPGDEPRFTMLETIREFGVQMLAQHGEEDDARRAHANWFVALAERAAPHLVGPEQTTWLDRLDADRDNIRSALHFLSGQRDVETALRLGAAVWRFWLVRRNLGEGRQQLAALRELATGHEYTDAHIGVLNALGIITFEQGDNKEAVVILEEVEAICRRLGNMRGLATALTNLGWAKSARGDTEAVRSMSQEALEISEQLGDKRGIATAIQNIGAAAVYESKYDTAMEFFERNLRLRRELGEKRGIAYAFYWLGMTMLWVGRLDDARNLARQGIETVEGIHDRQIHAVLLGISGFASLELLDLESASMNLRRSHQIWQESGNNMSLNVALRGVADLEFELGNLDRAEPMVREALAQLTQLQTPWGQGLSLLTLGHILRARGDNEGAMKSYAEAKAFLVRISDPVSLCDCLMGMAAIELARGDLSVAAQCFAEAQSRLDAVGVQFSPRQRRRYAEVIAVVGGGPHPVPTSSEPPSP